MNVSASTKLTSFTLKMIFTFFALLLSSSAFADNEAINAKVLRKVKCAMTEQEVVDVIGVTAKQGFSCGAGESIFLYGSRWVYFKGGAATAIFDHKDYQGPCVELSKLLPGGVTAYWICK